ncbi:S26 family signal peptidase [Fusobacterium polymorphum]|uniref:S26 family signal peptidase n=1 Tax=Fusobacterium nucleatum subsp. polymorphum TaxID=76857 RepID=UPI00300A5EE7
MRIKFNSKILKIYLFFFIFILIFKIIAMNYTIVITESLPLGIYKLYPIKDTIKIGDIVQFKPDEDTVKFIKNRGYLPEIANTLVKEVAADYSNRDEIKLVYDTNLKLNLLYVGEKNYGPIFLKDSKGRDITFVSLEDLKPKNSDEFLLLSSHYKSYDSRYFGLINRKQILNKAKIKIKF